MQSMADKESPSDCRSTDRPSISSNILRQAWCPCCCSPRLSAASCSSLLQGAQHDLPREYSVGKVCVDKKLKSQDQHRPPMLHPYLEAQPWQEQTPREWQRTSLAVTMIAAIAQINKQSRVFLLRIRPRCLQPELMLRTNNIYQDNKHTPDVHVSA